MNTVERIHAKAPIYKYYIKHIRTGEIYLGKQWDAAESWHEALNNYLNNLTAK